MIMQYLQDQNHVLKRRTTSSWVPFRQNLKTCNVSKKQGDVRQNLKTYNVSKKQGDGASDIFDTVHRKQ